MNRLESQADFVESKEKKNTIGYLFEIDGKGEFFLLLGKRIGSQNPKSHFKSAGECVKELVCEPWEVSKHVRKLKGIEVALAELNVFNNKLQNSVDDWFKSLEVGSCIQVLVDSQYELTFHHASAVENFLSKAGFSRIERQQGHDGYTIIKASKITQKDERQVAPDLSGIRADHLARYELASGFLKSPMDVGDFACGIGYGTYILANSGPVRSVVGADIDAGAIEYAQQHYGTEKATFFCADLLSLSLAPGSLDIITSFETIEHIREPEPLLVKFNEFLKQGGLFLCSSPNEEVVPLASFGNPYHYCHYTPQEFEDMLKAAGFEVIGKYTQTERLSRDMHSGWHGIYNTAVCRKVAKPSGRRLSALRQRIEKKRSNNRKSGFQKLLSLAAIVLRPWRIVPALRHRVRHQASWRIRYHRVLAAACRLTGKKFIADMDWYGWANFNLSRAIDECGALKGKYVVRQLHRNFVFDFAIPPQTSQQEMLEAMTYKQLSIDGFNLWDICRTSIAKELGNLPGEEVNEKELLAISKYYQWARKCYTGVVDYFDKVKPHMVVVFQGGFFDSRIILECAKRRGIRVVAVESSFLEKYAFVDSYSGYIINRHSLAEQGKNLYKSKKTITDKYDPIKFWQEQSKSKSPDHRTGGGDIDSLSLPLDKKIILLIGQVASDASIVLDSNIYKSTTEFIIEVSNCVAKHPEWFLIIRLHPKEAWHVDTSGQLDRPGEYLWDNTLQSLRKTGYKFPSNSIIISGPEMNTYELMERSSVGITINSQAGFEMLLLGKAVVTAGRCFYSRNGFTYDLIHKMDLESKISEAMQFGFTDDAKEELHSFSAYLFEHYLLPKDARQSSLKADRFREILA